MRSETKVIQGKTMVSEEYECVIVEYAEKVKDFSLEDLNSELQWIFPSAIHFICEKMVKQGLLERCETYDVKKPRYRRRGATT